MKIVDVSAALEAYKQGSKLKAFQSLMDMAMAGNPAAEYWAAMICQENMMLFVASDLWNDLLKFEAEPRHLVAKQEYEILIWQGKISDATEFVIREGLDELEDIASRDMLGDDDFLVRQIGSNVNELIKLTPDEYPTTKFREALRALEIRSNLGAISSQMLHAGKALDNTNVAFARNDHFQYLDFSPYVEDAEKVWTGIAYDASRIIGDISQRDEDLSAIRLEFALLGQQAIERLFFLKGDMVLTTDFDRLLVTNIALALEDKYPVANAFYLGLVE